MSKLDRLPGWKSFNLCHHCSMFDAYKSCGSGDITFHFVLRHHMKSWSEGRVTYLVGTLQSKSPLYQIWCSWVLYKCRHNVFILLCDIMRPHDQRDMWLAEWKLLNRSHRCVKFNACRSSVRTFLHLSHFFYIL